MRTIFTKQELHVTTVFTHPRKLLCTFESVLLI